MPWTESRSREEWLAEVQRRGERIRRRRRLAAGVVGVLALVLPVGAIATFLGGTPAHEVELSAAAPAPVPTGLTDPFSSLTPTTVTADGAPDTTVAPAGVPLADPGQPAGGRSPTTTAEVRPGAPGVVAGADARFPDSAAGTATPAAPVPPPAAASTGDPAVVTPTTSPPGAVGGAVPGGASSATGTSNGSAATQSTLPPEPQTACPVSDVGVTVTTEKATYAPGETVSGSSTLENRSATTCLLPTRAFFRIDDSSGRSVGSFAYTTEFRVPVRAEPGKSVTSGFSWDQTDCSGPACVQVPPGAFVVVADWSEAGPYRGTTTFRIGA